MLFPPGSVALLQHLNAQDLPHTAQVYAKTSTPAPGGERLDTWSVVRTLPCRVRAIGLDATERLTSDQLAAPEQFRAVFEAGADVTEAHRLLLAGTDVAGRAWTVPVSVVSVGAREIAETQRTARCTRIPSIAA